MSDRKLLKEQQKNLKKKLKELEEKKREKNIKATRKVIKLLHEAENNLLGIKNTSFASNIPFIRDMIHSDSPSTDATVILLTGECTEAEIGALVEVDVMAMYPISEVFVSFDEVKTYLEKSGIERAEILIELHCALVEVLESL